MSTPEETGETQKNPEPESQDGFTKTDFSKDHSSPKGEFNLKNPEIPMNIEEETQKNPETESKNSSEPDFCENQSSPKDVLNVKNPENTTEETGETQRNPETESQEGFKKPEFCSPRGVLEIPVLGSDTDSSTSSNSSFSSVEKTIKQEGLAPESTGLHWRNFIQNIKKKSARRFSTLPLLITSSEITRRHLNRKLARIRSAEDELDLGLPEVLKPSWKNFNHEELATATDNFCPENLLGKGGYAEVYKGRLSDGQLVAVKRLTKKENKEGKEEEARTGDFLTELGIIAHVNHPNAARLIGFGVEGGLHIVLQFSPHGSLASLLHGSENTLEWKIRYKVASGVAEGLNYLHQGCHRRIIHRDIKASNILLTEDYEPQISDFGLAKWLPEKWTHHIVYPIEGTFGYLAPEYFMHGIVDEKTDVFAFGVLLLELITGRRAVDSSRQSLVIWAKPLLENKKIKELVDPRLGEDYMLGEMKNMMLAASMCIHHLSTNRPPMSRVVEILKGTDKGSATAAAAEMMMGTRSSVEQQKSIVGRGILFDACGLDDYTCSTYLNDLDRHKQLALLES
ncbi:Protein kinase domain [Macleaya cordata]|uniref:non-specific serine/threonine protein kinase n=1 Tax=Macleaya cordata TaxID=56857 RepID=A0A200PUE9_MACCD|nr:Protein kinase domain [Macleaya cordata]